MTKTKEGGSPPKDRLSRLLQSEIIGKIHKHHGDAILKRASDFKHQDWQRIPSQIFQLDYALGGGFPVGVVNTLWGDKGACKTTTIIKTLANAQRLCRDCFRFFPEYAVVEEFGCACKGKQTEREVLCAFIDVEGTLDLAWCRALGVNTERMLLSKPDYAEQSLDILEGLLRTGDVDVIVLDSLAFLAPKKEIEESHAKDLMGVQARAVAKGVRKLTAALNASGNEHDRRPTIFFTNQVRMMIGVMFGNPETQAAGKSPGFSATVEVKMRPGKYKMDESLGRPIYADMNFRVDKNKSSYNKIEGSFALVLGEIEHKKLGDVLDEPFMVEKAEIVGLLERKGGWTCLGEKFDKKEEVEQRLMADPVFKARVRHELLPLLLKA